MIGSTIGESAVNASNNGYDTVGSERVMFGIDSPFHHPSVEIQRVYSCGLNDAQLEDVFYNGCIFTPAKFSSRR